MTVDTQTLIDTLNAYQGDNIWGDVIRPSDLYDDDATDAIDPSWSSDRLVTTDSTVIRWDAQSERWDVA